MFSQSREISRETFQIRAIRYRGSAHALVTEAPPNVTPEISAFGICRQKLLILPLGNIEIAIDLAAAEQQVQQSLVLGVCGGLQRTTPQPSTSCLASGNHVIA